MQCNLMSELSIWKPLYRFGGNAMADATCHFHIDAVDFHVCRHLWLHPHNQQSAQPEYE